MTKALALALLVLLAGCGDSDAPPSYTRAEAVISDARVESIDRRLGEAEVANERLKAELRSLEQAHNELVEQHNRMSRSLVKDEKDIAALWRDQP